MSDTRRWIFTWLARIPRFFLLALLLHVLFGMFSFSVYLGQDIVTQARQQVQEMFAFTRVSRQALQRSRQSAATATRNLGMSEDKAIETPASPEIAPTSFEPFAPSDLPTVTLPPAAAEVPTPVMAGLELAPELSAPLLEEPLEMAIAAPRDERPEATFVPLEAVPAPVPRETEPPAATNVSVARVAMSLKPAVESLQTEMVITPVSNQRERTLSWNFDRMLEEGGPLEPPAMADTRRTDATGEVIPLEPRTAPVAQPPAPPVDPVARLEIVSPRRELGTATGAAAPQLPLTTSREASSGKGAPVQGDLAPPLGQIALVPAPVDRFGPKAPSRLVADDSIGLTAMLQLRQGAAKQDAVTAFGGSPETLAAVQRGLIWLAKHQAPEGYWSLNEFHKQCQGHECPNRGKIKSDPAATGFALMAFLGDGHTHQTGDYPEQVKQGLTWLIGQQFQDGDLAHGVGNNAHMYSHGIATIAVCEALAITRDPQLVAAAQKAVDFIVNAQHKGSGGWRYEPQQSADTSVVGWQVMALKSAQMAELNVPAETLTLVRKWLDSVQAPAPNLGRFGYVSRGPSHAMTAEALLCLQYLNVKRDDPSVIGGVNFLLERLPKAGEETSYYWYYGTQAMYHVQGEPWISWNQALRDHLVTSQIKEGPTAGTWGVRDPWEQQAGCIYSTTLRLLMLEVYYRHLPLY